MTARFWITGFLGISLAVAAVGQRHQGSGQMGSQGKGQQGSGQMGVGQAGTGQGQGQQTQMHTQQQMRIHATSQQQQQMRTCTQSTERLRSRVRQMTRLNSGQPIDGTQAKQLREQLRTELQTMQQEQQELMSGLSEDQKDSVKKSAERLQLTQEKIDQFANAIDMELALEAPQPEKVKDTARQMDAALGQMMKEQQKISSDLGINE